jgi:hypothetical protein
MYAAAPNNCTKEYAIDVFITKILLKISMLVTPIASSNSWAR